MDLEKLFNVEDTFATATRVKKKRLKRLRGPDSPLCTTLYPMICMMRIFGLAPYGYCEDRLVPYNYYLSFSLISASLYTYIIYVVYVRFNGLTRDKPLLGSTETVKVFSNYFVALFDIIHTITYRQRFVRIWNILQDFDENVRQLGYPGSEKNTKIWAWAIVAFHTLIWTLVNRMGMYAFGEKWIYNFSYMLIYLATFVSVYKFVGMVLLLGQRFKHLNSIAERNIPPRIVDNEAASILGIKTIENLHNDLMIAGEELALLYSWCLIFWLGNLSIHTVSNIFFIIDWLMPQAWENVTWSLIFCLNIWLVAFVSQLIALNFSCDYASTAANAIRPIMMEWQLQLSRHNKDISPKTTLHFINRTLQFSAAGCFSVDLPLLRSIAALLSTYLVILLQFPAQ
ncbi:putative gustatory receptor 2a isoform X2 [Prorops nasuta]|uniref:putative gustatory receptor 2a isoform X2 n=1 Tax=Prorops nasuta TaxID=863751 RepID=UPI0034D014A5